MGKIVVAIDGVSSCGKSTMAKNLAKAVGYTYVDSGAMYRAITFYALSHGFFRNDLVDEKLLRASLDQVDISFQISPENGQTETYLNGKNVEEEIRGMDVANKVSQIAAIDFVRHALVAKQQQLGQKKGLVMDGRDIGTVVFPDAELKIFVKASAAVRAQRRLDELLAKGQQATYEEVLENVEQRDQMDINRKVSPLRRADDAIELDNTDLTIHEQQDWLLNQFKRVIEAG